VDRGAGAVASGAGEGAQRGGAGHGGCAAGGLGVGGVVVVIVRWLRAGGMLSAVDSVRWDPIDLTRGDRGVSPSHTSCRAEINSATILFSLSYPSSSVYIPCLPMCLKSSNFGSHRLA